MELWDVFNKIVRQHVFFALCRITEKDIYPSSVLRDRRPCERLFPLVNAKCKLHYPLPGAKMRGTAGHQCQTESRLRIAGLRYPLFLSNHCIFLPSTNFPVLPHRRFPLHTFNHPRILLPTSTSPPGLVRVTSSSQRFIQLWATVSKNLHKNQRRS